MKECEGPSKDRRVLAALRSGKHPDSRPPYEIGIPRPLFAHVRAVVDPFPMLPKSGGRGKPNAPASLPSSSGTAPGLQRGKRDLTPVPQHIDFLAVYGKLKVPRVRSPFPNPYNMPSSTPAVFHAPAPVTPPYRRAREFCSAGGSGPGGG